MLGLYGLSHPDTSKSFGAIFAGREFAMPLVIHIEHIHVTSIATRGVKIRVRSGKYMIEFRNEASESERDGFLYFR